MKEQNPVVCPIGRRRVAVACCSALLGLSLAVPSSATTVSPSSAATGARADLRASLGSWRTERLAQVREQLLQKKEDASARRDALMQRATDLREDGRERRERKRREAEALREAMQAKRQELLAQMNDLDARMGDLRRDFKGEAPAVVPLPGAVVLLASGIAGLFGVAGIRRRPALHDHSEVAGSMS